VAAVYTYKLSLTVALDLAIWLLAVIGFFFLIKSPVELYLLVRTKNRELEQKKLLKLEVNEDMRALSDMEYRMFRIALAVPFASLFGWFGIEEFCRRYQLNSMTDLVQPQYMLFIALVAAIVPIHDYLQKQKHRLVHKHTDVSTDVSQLCTLLRIQDTKVEELTTKLKQQSTLTEQIYKKFDGDVRSMRKEVSTGSVKSENLHDMERRVLSLENQVELLTILLKEKQDNKGILDMLVGRPLKALAGQSRR